MKSETEEIVHKGSELFPLKSYPNIIQANALHVDWPKTDYVISKPPFVVTDFKPPRRRLTFLL